MSGLSLGIYWSNLKSVVLTVLLAFNAQKFGGHVTLGYSPFSKKIKGS